MTIFHLHPDTIHEHIALFTKAPSKIYLGHIASAAVLIYLGSQSPSVPAWFLYLWAAIEIVITPAALGWLVNSYKNNPAQWVDKPKWVNRLDGLFLLVGLSWGTMMFVSLNSSNAVHFSMQMAIIAGAGAASVKSLGIFPRSFALYGISFFGLVAARVFMLGGDYIFLGVLIVVFLIMLLGLSKDTLLSIKQYIEIKNQNLKLAKQYQDAAARADNANREKTRLLATASHDLRQPFHAIGLYLETLTGRGFSEQDEKTITQVKHSLDGMTRLFNSLLDVSLLDEEKVEVNRSKTSAHKLISGIVEDFRPIAKVAGVSIELNVPDLTIFCDPILLRRMVQNLISNSIKYGGGSPITAYATKNKETMSICVKDLGPGIPAEAQAIIFEEFAQLDRAKPITLTAAPSHQERGLGLGLAIVKRLAQLQGIKVKLVSDATGTTFLLEGIPISETPIALKGAAQLFAKDSMFKNKLILIIDDDTGSLKATSSLLAYWGCRTITSEGTGKILEGLQPDFIICDFELSDGKTGLDVLQSVKKVLNKSVPALIISGNSSIEVRQAVEKAGLNLINKPVQPVKLRSALLQGFTS